MLKLLSATALILSRAAADEISCTRTQLQNACDARHLTCGDTVIGNTATDGINCLGNDAPDVVYSFSLQEPQAVSFSTCGTHTDFDTYLRLYRNCIGDVLDSNDDSACEQVYFASSIEAVLEAGSYSIVVEGWGTETGNYELSVTCASSCSGESINEVCYSHQLQCGDTVYGATSIDGVSCVGNAAPEAYYWFEMEEAAAVTLTTCNEQTDFDTYLRLDNDCGGEGLVTRNDDDHNCAQATSSSIEAFVVEPGRYVAIVEGFGTATGSYGLTLECDFDYACTEGHVEQVCHERTIECGETVTGNNAEDGISCHGEDSPEVLYSFSLPHDSAISLTTCSSNTDFDTEIAVYNDCDFSVHPRELNDDDYECDASHAASTISDTLQAGHYVVAVEGVGTSTGNFEMTLTCEDGCGAETLSQVCYSNQIRCGETIEGNTATDGTTCIGNPGPEVYTYFELTERTMVRLSTCNSTANFDTYLRLYDDCAGEGLVASNDDDHSCQSSHLHSTIDGQVLEPGTYVVVLEGYGESSGDYGLTLQCNTDFECEGDYVVEQCFARELTCGDTVTGNTWTDGISCFGQPSPEVLYHMSIPQDSFVHLTTCHDATDFDTEIEVYAACDLDAQPLHANDDAGTEACPSGRAASEINELMTAGEYIVAVEGWASTSGNYELSLECTTGCEGETLEQICYSTQMTCGESIVGDTSIDGVSCIGNASPVYTYFTLDAPALVTLSTCDSAEDFDTFLRLYEGCGDVDLVASNDDDASCGSSHLHSTIDGIALDAGTYVVVVEGFAEQSGAFGLSLECDFDYHCSTEQVVGACEDAPTIGCGGYVQASTSSGSAISCIGNESPEVLVNIVIEEDSSVVLTTCSEHTDYDTLLRLYEPSATTCVANEYSFNDDDHACHHPGSSTIRENLAAGQYTVAVEGYAALEGNFRLSLECANACSGESLDELCYGNPIGCGQTVFGNTETDGVECLGNSGPEMYYHFTLDEPSTVRFTTCNEQTEFDTYLRLYRGCGADEVANNDDSDWCGGGMTYSTTSTITETLSAGSYVVVVEGFADTKGTFALTVECGINPNPVSEACSRPDLVWESTAHLGSDLDDVEQSMGDGHMDFTSNDLQMINAPRNGGDQLVGLRFEGLEIPPGAQVCDATVAFIASSVDYQDTQLVIQAVDSGNVGAWPQTEYGVTSKLLTEASVAWQPEMWSEVGQGYDTPDLAPLVQQVVDKGDWASGNPLAFVVSGSGRRTAAGFNMGEEAPELRVSWVDGDAEAFSYSYGHGNHNDCADLSAMCEERTIGCGEVVYTSTTDITHNCFNHDDTNISPEVVYTFTLAVPKVVSLSTCASSTNFDTFMWLFDGCIDRLIDANDDSECTQVLGSGAQSSHLETLLTKGTYSVVVEGAYDERGHFSLGMTCEDVEPPAVADPRELGVLATDSTYELQGTTEGLEAGQVPNFPVQHGACSACANSGDTVSSQAVYAFTLEEDMRFAASTCLPPPLASAFDTYLLVVGKDGTPWAVNDDMGCSADGKHEAGMDGCAEQLCAQYTNADEMKECQSNVVAGQAHLYCSDIPAGEYYLAIGGSGATEGEYYMRVATGEYATQHPLEVAGPPSGGSGGGGGGGDGDPAAANSSLALLVVASIFGGLALVGTIGFVARRVAAARGGGGSSSSSPYAALDTRMGGGGMEFTSAPNAASEAPAPPRAERRAAEQAAPVDNGGYQPVSLPGMADGGELATGAI